MLPQWGTSAEAKGGGIKMPLFDHVAVRSTNVAEDVERYRRLGFKVEACHPDWGMVRDARGVGVALLGPGSHHPPHFAMRVASLAELEQAAAAEKRKLIHHRDRSVSFYTAGAEGLALEFIWYPEKSPESGVRSPESGSYPQTPD
jgi:hypothetical protein